MALAKSNAAVDEWANIVAAAIREGATIDLSGNYGHVLNIAVAQIEAVAHANGVLVTVEGRFGAEDEDWRTLTEFRTAGGTAVTVNVDVESAAEATQLKVDSTGGSSEFETKMDRYFVHNTVAVGNSEIVRNNGFADNDYITLLDGLKNTQETSANVYNLVDEFTVELPAALSTARVLVWNDDADCDVCSRTDIAKQTGI